MASKQVGFRQRMAGALRAAVTAWKGEVTPALNERVRPFLGEEEAEIDFSRLQDVLARMVAASLEEMIEADKAHIDELAGDGAQRTRRGDAVAALRRKLIEIRAIAMGLFGAKRSREIIAVTGRIASQPDRLWRQGEHTLTRLKDPALELPESTTSAFRFDPGRLADELGPLVKELRRATDAVEGERRQAELTLAVKQAALAEHDRLMGACGRILSGLHLLADRPDLARRIRVTTPRLKSDAARKGTDAPAEAMPQLPVGAPGHDDTAVGNRLQELPVIRSTAQAVDRVRLADTARIHSSGEILCSDLTVSRSAAGSRRLAVQQLSTRTSEDYETRERRFRLEVAIAEIRGEPPPSP